jgi:hypothetical protein
MLRGRAFSAGGPEGAKKMAKQGVTRGSDGNKKTSDGSGRGKSASGRSKGGGDKGGGSKSGTTRSR